MSMLSWMRKKDISQSTFASIIAHDLRTPLSVVKWYTEILLDGDMGELNEEQKKYLHVISSSNQKAIRLITSLLNVSRLELDTLSISPEPLLFPNVMEEVLKKYVSKASEKNVQCRYSKQGDFYSLSFDKKIAEYFLCELLENAIRFSKNDSTVDIVLTGSPSSITYKVTDSGIGIKEEEKSHIGSKLFKGSNSSDEMKSSGLGLYIIKMLTRLIGGTFAYTSEINIGSTFSVTIPNLSLRAKKGNSQLEV
jgi:signal transduction histidine kinase